MTPERQKWWDSLPKEEKRVRMDIDEFKRMIRHNKKHLIPYVAFAKYCIRYNKKAIKALRKEIAMDVIALHNSAYEYYTCPYCGQNVREGTGMRDEDRYCASCGQKLRWQE